MNFNFSTVKDTDESLQSKGSVQFGLNTGKLTNFAYNPNGGKDGAPKSAFDIEVEVNGIQKHIRLFEPVGTLKYGNSDVNEGDPDYEKAFVAQMTQVVAVIKHFAKAVGVTDEQMDAINATDFRNWAIAVSVLLPADWKARSIDIFFEYQYSIQEGQNKTYPTLPTNMKGGKFVCASIAPVGSWKPVVEPDGALHYEDDNKNVHIFKRNAAFMNGNKGKQQDRTQSSSVNLGGGNNTQSIW